MGLHVIIIVLGDIGRSPRMQYHAMSICECKSVEKITLIGYEGEKLFSVINMDKVQVVRIKPFDWQWVNKIPLLFSILKGVSLFTTLFYLIITLQRANIIFLQNPPVLPSITAAYFATCIMFQRCKILVDWHNLGFTMYKGRLSDTHLLVKLSKFMEKILPKYLASHHICVSKALRDWLDVNFQINSMVLYDRPPKTLFECEASYQINLQSLHQLLIKLKFQRELLFAHKMEVLQSSSYSSNGYVTQTNESLLSNIKCTIKTTGDDMMLQNSQTAMVISSTSWTDDEDFTLLLNTMLDLELYLKCRNEILHINGFTYESNQYGEKPDHYFNEILFVITGKGPLREEFEKKFLNLVDLGHLGKYVTMRTVWLESQEYPLLLRAADVGICLHASTSGLDLPMKVLDMLGSGLPICAMSFPALPELIENGVNGLIFYDSVSLSFQLLRLLIEPNPETIRCILQSLIFVENMLSIPYPRPVSATRFNPVLTNRNCSSNDLTNYIQYYPGRVWPSNIHNPDGYNITVSGYLVREYLKQNSQYHRLESWETNWNNVMLDYLKLNS